MTKHPISTPPDHLISEWINRTLPQESHPYNYKEVGLTPNTLRQAFTSAARWGADQELESCIEWLGDAPCVWKDDEETHPGSILRDVRRPMTIKEAALGELDHLLRMAGYGPAKVNYDTLKKILEALPND